MLPEFEKEQTYLSYHMGHWVTTRRNLKFSEQFPISGLSRLRAAPRQRSATSVRTYLHPPSPLIPNLGCRYTSLQFSRIGFRRPYSTQNSTICSTERRVDRRISRLVIGRAWSPCPPSTSIRWNFEQRPIVRSKRTLVENPICVSCRTK